ncbi:MAG: hypothetical protein AAF664_21020 [Planctomycetota bacterium]
MAVETQEPRGKTYGVSFPPAFQLWHLVALVCISTFLLGCDGDNDGEEASAKHSHTGHSHAVAGHWPRDLLDLKFKLLGRMNDWTASDGDREVLQSQIIDLIQWTPEVAADTDLSEDDWVPIYESSQKMIQMMDGAENVAEVFESLQFEGEFNRLVGRLQEAAKSLPSSFRKKRIKF